MCKDIFINFFFCSNLHYYLKLKWKQIMILILIISISKHKNWNIKFISIPKMKTKYLFSCILPQYQTWPQDSSKIVEKCNQLYHVTLFSFLYPTRLAFYYTLSHY